MPVISVVDDDASIRRALRRLLGSAGYDVAGFASAVECLASGLLGQSACLVLDVHLEGMTGFELHERLVAERYVIPIVFITAHDDPPTRKLIEQARPAGYVPKPFDAAVLLAAVGSAAGPA